MSRSKVTRFTVVVGAILATMVTVACSTDGPSCDAPEHVTYTCEPTDELGCSGGPYWDGAKDHPDTVYPAGCFAELPECSRIFRGKAVMEKCADLGSGLVWETPE